MPVFNPLLPRQKSARPAALGFRASLALRERMVVFFINDDANPNGFEDVPCNLCGSKDFQVVYDAVPQEKGGGVGKGAGAGFDSKKFHVTSASTVTERVVKCRKCGLVFINPRPKQEAVLEGYANASGAEYVSQADGRVETFRSAVRLLEEKAFPGGKPAKPRVLDVGSAAGFFLKAAKDAGWDACGIEPNKWMVNWGNKQYGLRMQPGTLEGAGFEKNYFDIVTLWDVLEHVADPKKTLLQVNGVLKKGGVVAVNFPNISSSLARIAGKRWWFLTSVHLYYFTPETLKEMLGQAGFEVFLVKRHCQKLNLGYMLDWHRKQSIASGKGTRMHDFLIGVLKGVRLYDKKITYYASQTLVLARKK